MKSSLIKVAGILSSTIIIFFELIVTGLWSPRALGVFKKGYRSWGEVIRILSIPITFLALIILEMLHPSPSLGARDR